MEQEKTVKTYSEEFKSRIIKECLETGKYSIVADKHEIPPTTVYGWIMREKNKDKTKTRRKKKDLEKAYNDLKLENEILKELLKKTNQLWLND